MQFARENCRRLRDVLPRATWERVNSMYLTARHDTVLIGHRADRQRVLENLIQQRQSVGGLLSDCMSHDVSYQFIRLGESIERADMTTRTGDTTSIAYNAQGRVSTVTDPAGRVATYSYDAGGEHLASVTTVAGVTRYGYVTGQGAASEHALAAVVLLYTALFTLSTTARLGHDTRIEAAHWLDATLRPRERLLLCIDPVALAAQRGRERRGGLAGPRAGVEHAHDALAAGRRRGQLPADGAVWLVS